jgi:hypothetical protein
LSQLRSPTPLAGRLLRLLLLSLLGSIQLDLHGLLALGLLHWDSLLSVEGLLLEVVQLLLQLIQQTLQLCVVLRLFHLRFPEQVSEGILNVGVLELRSDIFPFIKDLFKGKDWQLEERNAQCSTSDFLRV